MCAVRRCKFSLLCVIAMFSIAGCATTPRSAGDVRTAAQAKLEVCSERPKDDVALYIKEKLESCSTGSSSAGVLMTLKTFVEMDRTATGGYQISLVNEAGWNRFHSQLIDVDSTADCTAHVVIYGMTKHWKKYSEQVAKWIRSWNALC